MKIIITGSLGNISKPLTKELVQKGHSVTVVSSKPDKKEEIESMGAIAAIGSVENAAFLTTTFKGADAVYCMLPPANSFFDQNFDLMAYVDMVVDNYVQAIKQSGVKHVVYLSSIGAHTNKGNGILSFHYNAENSMNKLPVDVAITFMRPVGFYYNLLNFINAIKTQGVMASNYGAEDMIPWVSPIDIACVVAEEIVKPFTGRNIRYVASEEITCDNIAGILGAAIGKPDLKWIIITNEKLLNGMVSMGMNPNIAAGFVEMNAAQHSGILFEDYYRNKPTLGKVKIADYAKEFADVFNQK
jgi:uncharacterized protein YbjT (DUF2867 family)